MIAENELRERVKRGAAYLDETNPGWWYRINRERLKMRSSCDCIWGQLGEDFNRIMESRESGPHWTEWAAEHGFYVLLYLVTPYSEFCRQYAILDRLWLAEIDVRLAVDREIDSPILVAAGRE